MRAEVGVTQCKARNTKDCQQITRSQTGEGGLSYRYQRKCGPADTLILAISLQNCETKHFYYFQSQFVDALLLFFCKNIPRKLISHFSLFTLEKNKKINYPGFNSMFMRGGHRHSYTLLMEGYTCTVFCWVNWQKISMTALKK